MKSLLVVAVLLGVPAAAQAENWRVVGYNRDYPAIVTFVDADSVRRTGNSAEVKLQYYLEGANMSVDERSVQRRRVNCTTFNYQMLAQQYYIGKTLQPAKPLSKGESPSAEGSIDKGIADAACGRPNYMSETVADPARYSSDYFADLAYEDEEDY